MNVTVNGVGRRLPDATTLAELLEQDHLPPRGSAAAVDGAVVPRSQWRSFHLADGSRVEVITAVQGG
jgi:sulfur carrier protein